MADLCIIEKQMSIIDQSCWSMDSVRSELGIDWTNPWIAHHFFRSITDTFREILILMITRVTTGQKQVVSEQNMFDLDNVTGTCPLFV